MGDHVDVETAQALYNGDRDALSLQGFREAGSIVESAEVVGDELRLEVGYGGGCEEHDFELHWDGSYLETFPAQVDLTLYHNANDDFCEAFIRETLVFDISSLEGELVINIANAEVALQKAAD